MLKPGDKIGEFEICSIIGEGGFGRVYRAIHRGPAGFERQVAIKVLLEGHSQDPDLRRAFEREARIVGRLSHRSIVQVVDFAVVESRWLLVMEYVDGVTLRQLLNGVGEELPPWVGLSVVVELSKALHYAHELTDDQRRPLGIIHRDIKPTNVLINTQGDVKLTDFGLAKMSKVARDVLTVTGSIKGTPAYMSPEQASGSKVGTATDVYSLALVLYQTLTGRLPRDLRYDDLGQPKDLALPPLLMQRTPALLEGINACLRRRPDDRPRLIRLRQLLDQSITALAPLERLTTLSDELGRWVVKARERLASARPERGGGGTPARVAGPGRQGRPFAPEVVQAEVDAPGVVRHSQQPTSAEGRRAAARAPDRGSEPEVASGDSLSPPLRRGRLVVLFVAMALLLVAAGILVVVLADRGNGPLPAAGGDTPPGQQDTSVVSVQDGRTGTAASAVDASGSQLALPDGAAHDAAAPDGRLLPDAQAASKRPHRRRPRVRRRPVKPWPRKPLPAETPRGTGTLSVNTSPWSRVYLDGRLLGSTPLFERSVPAGKHTLRLVPQRGRARQRIVTIQPSRHLNLGLLLLD